MATLAELRAKAKRLGIAATVIRGASTARELQSVIADFNEDEKPAKKTVAKKASPATTPKRRGRPPGSRNKPKVEEAPKRRGRPPGSGVKKSASGTKAPAKSTRGTAKRPSTARRTVKAAPQPNPEAGRFLLEQIDYTETDGWNPRDGSAPDRIVKALRKFRGNREKVFDFLSADVWDFVGKYKQNGDKRTKQEALDMLRYRIARTDWEFATRTGQHQKSENRAEYTRKAPVKATARKAAAKPAARKAAAPKAPARRGRPPKAAQAPQEAPKRRGRPPGSKNKPKVAAKATAPRKTATRRTAQRRTRR
jgi:hypothetical protein